MGDDDGDDTVHVFIMMGQSNMLGFGMVEHPKKDEDKPGTLVRLVEQEGKYPELKDADGNWTKSSNVKYIQTIYRKGHMDILKNEMLTVPPSNEKFGPEIGFGSIIGPYFEAKGGKGRVMLLKACIGNRSLGWDLLPPGSERFEYEGNVWAGYKDSPGHWEVGTEKPPPQKWYAGKQYDDDTSSAKEVLAKIEEYGAIGEGDSPTKYKIAGFLWWQGHKDHYHPVRVLKYEETLVRLIKQLRVEFDAPDAKFVVATVGHDGLEQEGAFLGIANAQLAVDGDAGKYPEFANNVKTVDTRPFWRTPEQSPVGQHHHYNQNAETFIEVGKAMGEAMVELLKKEE